MKFVTSAFFVVIALFLVGCPSSDPDPDPGPCPIGEVFMFDACRTICTLDRACPAGQVCYEPTLGCAPPNPCLYVDCPSDQQCVAGECLPSCTSNTDCAEGFCAGGGYCNDDSCDAINCPTGQACKGDSCHLTCAVDGDCAAGETCEDGVCISDPCDTVVCPASFLCFDGACYPGCLSDDDCGEGVSCIGNACVDPCADVTCGADQVCDDGTCYDNCSADAECGMGQFCRDGRCTEDPCLGVQCPGDRVCYEGSCYDFCVDDGDCTPPNHCYDSRCAEDPCDGVQCPAGTACNLGTCKPSCDGGCPANTTCFADSFCDQEDLCANHPCPISQLCYEGSCYDVCVDDGDCTPPDVCYVGRCAPDPCEGVLCPIGQLCYAGSCFEPCTQDDVCDPQSSCWDGRCATDPCDGVQCRIGASCYEGACYDVCVDDGDCSPPNSCFLGYCLEHPCAQGSCTAPATCDCPVLETGSRNVTVPAGESLAHFTFDAQEGELITLRAGSNTTAGTLRYWDSAMELQYREGFTVTDNAWIPARIPKTDTYRVTVELDTPGEGFSIELQRYGLETPVGAPGFVGMTATTNSNESFLFFAPRSWVIAADAVPTTGNGGGSAFIEVLTRDRTWSADIPTQFFDHPSSGPWNFGKAVPMTAFANERGIYRVRITRNFGVDPLGVRIGVVPANEGDTVVDTDLTGCAPGIPTIFPRVSVFVQNDITVCPGTHLEYGTMTTGSGFTTITGGGPGAIIRQGDEAPIGTPLVSLDEGRITFADLQLVRPRAVASPTFELLNGSDQLTLRNLQIDMGATTSTSQNTLFATVDPVDEITVEGVTLSGGGDIGSLRGDDIVIRDSFFGSDPSDRIGVLAIIGERAQIVGNVFGNRASISSFVGGPSITGNDAVVRDNEIYVWTNSAQINAGNSASSTNRVSNATVEGNLIVSLNTLASAPWGFIFIDVDNLHFAANKIETDSPKPAIELRDSSGLLVNNRITASRAAIISIANYNDDTITYPVDIRHNTLRLDGAGNVDLIDISPGNGSFGTMPITIWNTIFRNQTSSPTNSQCPIYSGLPLTAVDFNLYDNFSTGCVTGSATLGVNRITDNANLTADLTLSSGSFAVDAGSNANSFPTDFEGDARPQGATVDIGADEL